MRAARRVLALTCPTTLALCAGCLAAEPVPALPAAADLAQAADMAAQKPPEDMAQPPDLRAVVVSLTEDRVLTGSDTLDLPGVAGAGCRIEGNGFSIIAREPWAGSLLLRGCEITGLGKADRAGIDVTVGGAGQVTLIGNTFAASGAIRIINQGLSQATFRDNRILDSALVPVGKERFPLSESAPVFVTGGESPMRKLFQGNTIYRSWALFDRARNWMIGGDDDSATNVFIGLRAGVELVGSADLVVRGNYLNTYQPARGWGQVVTVDVVAPQTPVLLEHNVIRGGQWLARGVVGEVRYNLLGDFAGQNWLQGPGAGARVHHNVCVFGTPFADYQIQEGINLYQDGGRTIEIFNNTFDAGGLLRGFTQPAVLVTASGFLGSLRNNAFVHFPFAQPAVYVGYGESPTPRPDRLGYADYNLFYSPDATIKAHYGLGVVGKTEGTAGFGGHDPGGRDGQVDPRFTGPPSYFPYSDDDLASRRVKVSQILARYKAAYTPLPGSPLIDGGDPDDGSGADIGAIDTGRPDPRAGFGAFPIR